MVRKTASPSFVITKGAQRLSDDSEPPEFSRSGLSGSQNSTLTNETLLAGTDGVFLPPFLYRLVSEPEPQSGAAAMVAALNVARNAKLGFSLAILVTGGLVALFVLPGTSRPTYLYAALAFVLVVSLGGLLTAVFTIVSAVRVARE